MVLFLLSSSFLLPLLSFSFSDCSTWHHILSLASSRSLMVSPCRCRFLWADAPLLRLGAKQGQSELKPPDSRALGCSETECHCTSGCLHVTLAKQIPNTHTLSAWTRAIFSLAVCLDVSYATGKTHVSAVNQKSIVTCWDCPQWWILVLHLSSWAWMLREAAEPLDIVPYFSFWLARVFICTRDQKLQYNYSTTSSFVCFLHSDSWVPQGLLHQWGARWGSSGPACLLCKYHLTSSGAVMYSPSPAPSLRLHQIWQGLGIWMNLLLHCEVS